MESTRKAWRSALPRQKERGVRFVKQRPLLVFRPLPLEAGGYSAGRFHFGWVGELFGALRLLPILQESFHYLLGVFGCRSEIHF